MMISLEYIVIDSIFCSIEPRNVLSSGQRGWMSVPHWEFCKCRYYRKSRNLQVVFADKTAGIPAEIVLVIMYV